MNRDRKSRCDPASAYSSASSECSSHNAGSTFSRRLKSGRAIASTSWSLRTWSFAPGSNKPCQTSAAQRWLEARQADLLPVPYYHVVFTLPAPISAIAYTNKEIIYGLLFDIAADPKHFRARIGTTLVLHTWGSALTHHPHVHGIVPGGGLALDDDRRISCKPGFFLSVRVLSRLFRRRFIEELQNAR